MQRKHRYFRAARLLLAAALLVSCALTGCKAKSVGNEKTVPIDRLVEAVLEQNVSAYKNAFLPDYIEAATARFAGLGGSIDDAVNETFSTAAEAFDANYGGTEPHIYYTLQSEAEVAVAEVLKEPYWDLWVDGYALPESGIEAAATVTVTIHIEGEKSEGANDTTFLMLKTDGIWYLHPKFFRFAF